MSLLYIRCQSTLLKKGFFTFVTFVLLFSLDINIYNFYQLFSEKKLIPQSQIYVIFGRLRAFLMSKDTHLLLGLIVRCEAHHLQNKKKGHLSHPVYGDLTHKYSDLTNIDSLIGFFNEVLDRRDQLDKQEKQNPVGGVDTSVYANSVLADRISQSRD